MSPNAASEGFQHDPEYQAAPHDREGGLADVAPRQRAAGIGGEEHALRQQAGALQVARCAA